MGEVAEAELVALIRGIFDTAEGAYGVPRIHRELRDDGVIVNVKRVTRRRERTPIRRSVRMRTVP